MFLSISKKIGDLTFEITLVSTYKNLRHDIAKGRDDL